MSKQRNNEMKIKIPIDIDRAVALITTEEEGDRHTRRRRSVRRLHVRQDERVRSLHEFIRTTNGAKKRKRDRRMSLRDWVASCLPH